MKQISEFPNVACKISGIAVYADHQDWTSDDLRPYVEHTIECFGWERVMFGSDWPVCTQAASYKQWVETLMLQVQSEDESNREKLFCKNAERIYRL
jgi:L-fuconolactonase